MTPSELSSNEKSRLIEAAEKARESAYAPYSHFKVGAAVLTAMGRIHSGCNVENSSYRLTTCAEQAAIASAITEGGKNVDIRAVAVTAGPNVPCSPCGACRQMILEFGPEAVVLYQGREGPTEMKITQLLPEGFGFGESR